MSIDDDRPDDSAARKHDRDSIAEEVSAKGQRFKGAVKETAGAIANDRSTKEKGERENEAGKERQRKNDAV